MFTLTLYPNDGTPFIVELPLKRLTMGRSVENHIVISSDYISARHACFEWFPEKMAWGIRDLGSRHGTRLNGNLVRKAPLKDGDILQFSAALIGCFKENKTEAVPSAEAPAAPAPENSGPRNAEARLREQRAEMEGLDALIALRRETRMGLDKAIAGLWEEEKKLRALLVKKGKLLEDLERRIAGHGVEAVEKAMEPAPATGDTARPPANAMQETKPRKRPPHGPGVDWVEAEMVKLGFEFHSMEVPRKPPAGNR